MRSAATPDQTVAEVQSLEAQELFARFQSSPRGLSSEKAERRLRRYGPNELPAARPPHPLRLLLTQVSHTLALLLWAAAGLAFVAGLPTLGWSILGIVAINAWYGRLTCSWTTQHPDGRIGASGAKGRARRSHGPAGGDQLRLGRDGRARGKRRGHRLRHSGGDGLWQGREARGGALPGA